MATNHTDRSLDWFAAGWLTLPGMNRQVAFFLLYSTLLFIGVLGITDAILNFYFVSLGHESETIGVLQSLPRAGGFLASLPVGLLANRIGERRVIIAATCGMFATYAMLIVWPNLIALGVSRFLLGLFFGAVQVVINPMLIGLAAHEHETRVFSYFNVVAMGGTAVGSFFGGYLPLWAVRLFPAAAGAANTVPEQTPFAYRAALAVATITIALSMLPMMRLAKTVDRRAGVGHTRNKCIPWARLAWLSLPLLIFGFTGGLTFPFYNLFFRTTLDVPDKTVGTILSLGWLGMALVPLANPWWDRRFGRVWALLITMSIAAIAFFGLSVAPTLAISIVCYVIAISFRNVMQPLYQPLVMDLLPPELRNIASSIGLVLWNIGWFSATAISGFWQKTYGFGVIMQIVAGGVFLSGVSVLLIFRTSATSKTSERTTHE